MRQRQRKYKMMAFEVAVRNPERYTSILQILKAHEGRKLDKDVVFEIVFQLCEEGIISPKDLAADATDEEIYEAARLANADSFIKHLPDGYDTFITNDGANLSQGQRQLLSIARAAVANPPILVLDEATSSIDTENEKVIIAAMNKVMKNRTSLIVAHRLSTVVNADKIIVLKNGKILEMGNHTELLYKKGYYFDLYRNQFLQDSINETLNN